MFSSHIFPEPTMLKLDSRSERAKAMKAKQIFQGCVLLLLCIWLLYQIKHSHDRNKGLLSFGVTEETSEQIMVQKNQYVELGRKNLDSLEGIKTGRSEEKGELLLSEEAGEVEEERLEDDETEQVEDLIDEDDSETQGGQ